jgi:hypothetical protein
MSNTIRKETDLMTSYLEGIKQDRIDNSDWEFHEWIEKAVGECVLIGYEKDGTKLEATGIMGGGEIVEVKDPKLWMR